MDSRKDMRKARLMEEIEKYRAWNPKITEQFADLKRSLHTMSANEWDSIPDIGDYSLRNKKRRFESFVGAKIHVTDLTAIGESKGSVLSGQTVVVPRGYLSMKIEISEIKKARLLLKSIIEINPKDPSGWIAGAWLEEFAGKIEAAREFINKGCEECPKNEDLWVKACLLASPKEAKDVLARGVKAIPNSVKLWLQAADLEQDDTQKIRVLRKGLEHLPNSVRLWKAVVELANEEAIRAVECCPLYVESWLALARLETYEKAREVLNTTRKRFPKEPAIWIIAAKLEESNGNIAMVEKIIERGIRVLQREGVVIDRKAWMKEAEASECAGFVVTCQAIIKHTVGIGVEEEDRKRTWMGYAEECKKRGSIETARTIYAHSLSVFLSKKSIRLKAAQLKKSYGTQKSLDVLLRRAVTYVPPAEVLWLMDAKEQWLADDVPAARAILQAAYAAVLNSEEIWLAAFELEYENHQLERAKMILAKARESGGAERVWMKSAIVERELGNVEEEKRLLDEGFKRFPSFSDLWLMRGQLHRRLGEKEKAKEAYESGLAALTLEVRHRIMEFDNLLAQTSGILRASQIESVPRSERISKILDALTKCDQDPHVIAAVAKKLDKARSLLKMAVTRAADIGAF